MKNIPECGTVCSFCSDPIALPIGAGQGSDPSYCAHCAADFGKYEQAFAQLDLLMEKALSQWLALWVGESFVGDLGEHLGQSAERLHAAALARLGRGGWACRENGPR